MGAKGDLTQRAQRKRRKRKEMVLWRQIVRAHPYKPRTGRRTTLKFTIAFGRRPVKWGGGRRDPRGHDLLCPYREERFWGQWKMESRTRAIVCFADSRAFSEPSSRISRTRFGMLLVVEAAVADGFDPLD